MTTMWNGMINRMMYGTGFTEKLRFIDVALFYQYISINTDIPLKRPYYLSKMKAC